MNIGILGTGSIARTMAAEFAKVPAFRCEAVCSRQQATGEALAQQFGIPKVYTDYDAMLADPDIELVYIATPTACTMRRLRRRFWPERTSSARSPSSLPWRRLTSSSHWRKRSTFSSSRPSPRPTTPTMHL